MVTTCTLYYEDGQISCRENIELCMGLQRFHCMHLHDAVGMDIVPNLCIDVGLKPGQCEECRLQHHCWWITL